MTREQINQKLKKLGYEPSGTLWKRPPDRQEQHERSNGFLTWANAAIEIGADPAEVIAREASLGRTTAREPVTDTR